MGLAGQRALGPEWATWLDRLPRLADEVLADWRLSLNGLPMHGYCSLVLPVRTADQEPAVLKLTASADEESRWEHLALRRWGGEGAVRLLRADPGRRALLLERCLPRDLTTVPELEACELVAGFYRRLHVPAPPQVRTVSSYVESWLAALAGLGHDAPIPRRMVEQALRLGGDLLSDPDPGVLVHGDLHFANVLAARREPWLVIDPKPMAGEPAYEVAPLLWNRWAELETQDSLRRAIRRRFRTVVEAAGLDVERARDWVIVRLVLNAHWVVEASRTQAGPLSPGALEELTRCVAVVKAVQD